MTGKLFLPNMNAVNVMGLIVSWFDTITDAIAVP